MRLIAAGVFGLAGLSAGSYVLYKRNEYLNDPVLQRAILHLDKDKRVIDFCGENVKPGWLITRERQNSENWVKFSFNSVGSSGNLKTTVIGDYMHHKDLLELEEERREYFEELPRLKAQVEKLRTKE